MSCRCSFDPTTNIARSRTHCAPGATGASRVAVFGPESIPHTENAPPTTAAKTRLHFNVDGEVLDVRTGNGSLNTAGENTGGESSAGDTAGAGAAICGSFTGFGAAIGLGCSVCTS